MTPITVQARLIIAYINALLLSNPFGVICKLATNTFKNVYSQNIEYMNNMLHTNISEILLILNPITNITIDIDTIIDENIANHIFDLYLEENVVVIKATISAMAMTIV